MSQRAIEILLHAYDYIWDDKSRPLLDRLAICNVLYNAARSIPSELPGTFLTEIFDPHQKR